MTAEIEKPTMCEIAALPENVSAADLAERSEEEEVTEDFPSVAEQMSSARLQRRQQQINASIALFNNEGLVPRLFRGEGANQGEDIASIIGALNCGSSDFRFGLITQLINSHDGIESQNAAIDTLVSGEPTDVFEGMLITQMATTHKTAMNALARMSNATLVSQLQAYEAMANKLLRTYATQMEALRKHRNKATQTVRHVHVHDGGQAIVAESVTHGGKKGAGDEK